MSLNLTSLYNSVFEPYVFLKTKNPLHNSVFEPYVSGGGWRRDGVGWMGDDLNRDVKVKSSLKEGKTGADGRSLCIKGR